MFAPLRRAIADVLAEPRVNVKDLEKILGISKSTIYGWGEFGEVDGHPSPPSLKKLVQLVLLTKDPRPIDALCRIIGGAYIPLPKEAGALNDALLASIKETADVASTVIKSLEDGTLTDAEARQSLKEIAEAKSALAVLEAAIIERLRREAA